jgi:hypothetical protein
MATPDALLNALRVPRQVVVDHQITELQVDTFRRGLGGDEECPAGIDSGLPGLLATGEL